MPVAHSSWHAPAWSQKSLQELCFSKQCYTNDQSIASSSEHASMCSTQSLQERSNSSTHAAMKVQRATRCACHVTSSCIIQRVPTLCDRGRAAFMHHVGPFSECRPCVNERGGAAFMHHAQACMRCWKRAGSAVHLSQTATAGKQTHAVGRPGLKFTGRRICS